MLKKIIEIVFSFIIIISGTKSYSQPSMHPGWPQQVGSPAGLVQKQGVIVFKHADEGWLIGARCWHEIALFRLDGTTLPGWPQAVPVTEFLVSGISMGDIDGDNDPEIVCAARELYYNYSRLYVWHMDGELDSSLIRTITPPIWLQSPTLADLDSNGTYEILYDNDSLHALQSGGEEYPGFPIGWGNDPVSPYGGVVVGNLNDNYIPDLVWASLTNVHARELGAAEELPGWPISIPAASWGTSPILIPTENGTFIAFAVETDIDYFLIHLWNSSGEESPPWPLGSGTGTPSYLSACDVDRNGEPDIVFISGSPWLYAFQLNGSQCPGFPRIFDANNSWGGVAAISNEVSETAWLSFPALSPYSAPNRDTTLVFLSQGTEVCTGFPVILSGKCLDESPALIPPENDTLMIAIANSYGYVAVWDVPFPCSGSRIEWQMAAANPQRNGVYMPTPVLSIQNGFRGDLVPQSPGMGSPFPNPSNAGVIIPLTPYRDGTIDFTIYNLLGRKVSKGTVTTYLENESKIFWNGSESNGIPVNSGVYFIKINDWDVQRKIVIVR